MSKWHLSLYRFSLLFYTLFQVNIAGFQHAIEMCLSSLANIKGLPSVVTQSVKNKPNRFQLIQKIAQSIFGLAPYTAMPLFVELMIIVNSFISSEESVKWRNEVKNLRTELSVSSATQPIPSHK